MTDDRKQFVEQNALSLLQERDEKIERQAKEIARLLRSVNTLKGMLQDEAYGLNARWRLDPYCHWCSILTLRPSGNTPKGGPPDTTSTLDHLISKKAGNGQKGKEVVLACYFCNFQRNNAEQKGRPLRANRNGIDITFLPDGSVWREETEVVLETSPTNKAPAYPEAEEAFE